MRVFLSSLVPLLACERLPSELVDGGINLPSEDAGLDAGPRCAPLTHAVDGGCAQSLFWVELAPGPKARDHHATALVPRDGGATLYVSGGVDLNTPEAFVDLWFQNLGDDGLPNGPWQRGPTPPAWHSGSGVETWGRHVYVVSGVTLSPMGSSMLTPTVHAFEAGPDGTPGPWRTEAPLPNAGAFHITTTRVGRFLFAISGRSDMGQAFDTVFRTHIRDDGSLEPWVAARSLPETRTHHASATVGSRLYVIGGFDAVTFSDTFDRRDLLVATVADDGELSPWSRQALPSAMSTHSAAVENGAVYLLGGFGEAIEVSAAVRRSTVLPDGSLGPWESLEPLPFARAHVHHTPMWNGRIYSVGGNVGQHDTTGRAFVGMLY